MAETTTAVAPPAQTEVHGATIELKGLTKRYPRQQLPAVDNITLTIPAGDIVVLVGPSGCGKTTTMRLINRLIEPTSGEILIDGENVLRINPDELRRRIGYVIQQIGLFPHMRIADNVAAVPRMLGWKRSRIDERVEELLDLVGLSGDYARRYPRELSGGQQQRVGVARALAADPPVMLMDEPFGATDPITREHLQDEFLRLQRGLRKTIVFVTHDFTEALKMGDRIAVLRERSKIAQYDTPERILAEPADDYVASFIGSGGQLQRLSLMPLRDAELHAPVTGADVPVITVEANLRDALDVMLENACDTVMVAKDEDGGSPMGSISLDDVMAAVQDDETAPAADADPEAGRTR